MVLMLIVFRRGPIVLCIAGVRHHRQTTKLGGDCPWKRRALPGCGFAFWGTPCTLDQRARLRKAFKRSCCGGQRWAAMRLWSGQSGQPRRIDHWVGRCHWNQYRSADGDYALQFSPKILGPIWSVRCCGIQEICEGVGNGVCRWTDSRGHRYRNHWEWHRGSKLYRDVHVGVSLLSPSSSWQVVWSLSIAALLRRFLLARSMRNGRKQQIHSSTSSLRIRMSNEDLEVSINLD